jgi:nucleoside-diphosphate-sugar epimerase
MNILMLGGTGFISRLVTERLVDSGHRVALVTRGLTPCNAAWAPRVRWIRADRTDPSALKAALAGQRFDVVYDMVAYLPEESRTAAELLRGRIGRFVHCSTISVYMVSREARCPITEDQDTLPPMQDWPQNPFGMDYGIQKRECERVLWQHHDEKVFPVTMVRPTFVSGPADPAQRDWFWIQRILDGGPVLIPGSGDFAFQQVFVDDVARLFVRILEIPKSIGRAYNVAGEEIFSLREYLAALGKLMGRQPEIVSICQEEFERLPLSIPVGGDVFPFNVRRTAVFSLDRAKQELGYRSTPFDVWMEQTIRWWSQPGRGDSYGWARRKEELRIAVQRRNQREQR